MLGFFPTPYPDELFYSVIARYHRRAGYKYETSTYRDVFGCDRVSVSIDFPNNLSNTISLLPSGSKLSVKRFIEENSLFPLYAPFYKAKKVIQLVSSLTSKGGGIHARLGSLTSLIKNKFIRFCPVCLDEDISSFGEAYWHRNHQIPGIPVCYKHKAFLEDSVLTYIPSERKIHRLLTAKEILSPIKPRYIDATNRDHQVLLSLAEDANWLLEQKEFAYGEFEARMIQRYRTVLFQSSLATYRGVIYMTEINELFKSFYSNELFKLVFCKIEKNNSWLQRLLQNSRNAPHPIQHLLVVRFLGYSIEEFFRLPLKVEPYGKPPYPCLNAASSHLFQMRIMDCEILNKQGRKRREIQGTFRCDCGFVYRKYGWDINGERRFTYDNILSYGDVWNQKLRELWQKNTSKLEICEHLHIGLTHLNRRLALLEKGLPLDEKQLAMGRKKFDQNKLNILRDLNRALWIKTKSENPTLCLSELRLLIGTVYSWLQKNDNNWRLANSPPAKRKIKGSPVVDWEKRDEELLESAKQIVTEIINSPKPICLSFTGLSRRLGIASLIRNFPQKIPKTTKLLQEISESREEFMVRRINWAAERFIEEGIYARRYQLQKRAMINNNYRKKEFIIQALDEAVKNTERVLLIKNE